MAAGSAAAAAWAATGSGSFRSIKRVDFQTAASLVETVVGKVAESGAGKKTDKAKPTDPMKPWREAGAFLADSPVDRYFRFRALIITAIEAQSLHYAASLFHWPSKTRWPAIVAQITLATGEPRGSHMTFVRHDGAGKAPVDRPRLFSGGTTPCGGGIWFGKADPEREFPVAEGLESLLSGMRLSGVEAGGAALSELGIRRLLLPDEARRVRIYADHDEAGQGLSAAREAARRWKAEGRDGSRVDLAHPRPRRQRHLDGETEVKATSTTGRRRRPTAKKPANGKAKKPVKRAAKKAAEANPNLVEDVVDVDVADVADIVDDIDPLAGLVEKSKTNQGAPFVPEVSGRHF